MAFPHPQSRKDHYRKEDIPSWRGIARKFFKRTINITEYRNAKDDVNPAKNRALGGIIHGRLCERGRCIVLLDIVLRSVDSRLLSRRRRPTGGLNAELLCVLGVQSLPAAELHGLGADDASNRLTREAALKDVEADVPARGAPRDEAAIDVVPQRQARAATKGFEFPPRIVVLKHLWSVGSRHSCFQRRGRSRPGELHRSNRTQVPISLKGRPLAQMRRVGKRLPDFFRRVEQFSDENERPLLPSFRTWAPLAGPGVYCSRSVIFFSVSFFSLVLIDPCGRGGVREHLRERTRTGGTEPAMHPPPEVVQVSVGRDGAVRPPWIPRNRPRAARAGAWIRSAAAYEADAQSLPPTVVTRPGGSISRGGSAPP
jgi:hypothetical protein